MTAKISQELGTRVLIGDGGMGTMLQTFRLEPSDWAGAEGCNEILNLQRPDVVTEIHRRYLAAGADWIETNTFGANPTALGDYGLEHRLGELAEAGARLARRAADEFTTAERPRFVVGSIGPGTKLPSLGQVSFEVLRDGYEQQVRSLIAGGVDAVQVETVQDLLQAKAAIIGAKRARAALGVTLPIWCSVTVEQSGQLLLGSDMAAVLAAVSHLGIDMLGLNCATGPDAMSEHLRYLARRCPFPVSCMPNAGLPELLPTGPHYPLEPVEFARILTEFAHLFGLASLAGCCGTTADHIAALNGALSDRTVPARSVPPVSAVSSLYEAVNLRQDVNYLSIGERANAAGSRGFRTALLAGNTGECVEIARAQQHRGAHLVDVCVDYVGRDGVADMTTLSAAFATAITQPLMLDSSVPEVFQAGLEHCGGRCVVNSVNFEDGTAPGSKFDRTMQLVREHGAAVVALAIDEDGTARTTEAKLAIAERFIEVLGQWGLNDSDIFIDLLTFPITTGASESFDDAAATLRALTELKSRHPRIGTLLGISNVSFGLNQASRQVLNSVFLSEALKSGLDAAIVDPARILPVDAIDPSAVEVARRLIWNDRSEYDPLQRLTELFKDATVASEAAARSAELAQLPLDQRLARRIVTASEHGLTDDLAAALREYPPLQIINDFLLEGMRTVGELFGSGQMQLPFVLASAETMKQAVHYLEPYIDRTDSETKGTLVLATVRGDVHDIGKNLVDIIVSNNGYKVVNLGIKQPISAIIAAAEQFHADAIGMSGLLVKSTLVMKDNLAELARTGLAERYPVLLGGAALTRSFVEDDLQPNYPGSVRYAADAFAGLALMDELTSTKPAPSDPLHTTVESAARPGRIAGAADRTRRAAAPESRSEVTRNVPVPTPPFWGSKVVRQVHLDEVLEWLDERTLFTARWGLREPGAMPTAQARLRRQIEVIRTHQLAEFKLVYGYWPVYSSGNELVVLDPNDPAPIPERTQLARFSFPRQVDRARLCIADYFRDQGEASELGPDVLGLQLVTLGDAFSRAGAQLFERDSYRDYFELHGLGVQLAEALAELWHQRIRAELGIAAADGSRSEILSGRGFQGARFSFGYPACPDLSQRQTIFDLLDATRIGVGLSDTFQLTPEQSTDALIVAHPQAHYFSVAS